MFDPHLSMWLANSCCRFLRWVFSWVSCVFMSWMSNWICLIAINSWRRVGVVPSSASTEMKFIFFHHPKTQCHRIKSVFWRLFHFLSSAIIKSNQIHTRNRKISFKWIHQNCQISFFFHKSPEKLQESFPLLFRFIFATNDLQSELSSFFFPFKSTYFLSFLEQLQWLVLTKSLISKFLMITTQLIKGSTIYFSITFKKIRHR